MNLVSLYISWALKNIVCVVAWIVLAMHFNKWWIALFGILFLSDIKGTGNYYRICDKCGKHAPYANSFNEALDKAEADGWIRKKVNDHWEDYCPDCMKEMKSQ